MERAECGSSEDDLLFVVSRGEGKHGHWTLDTLFVRECHSDVIKLWSSDLTSSHNFYIIHNTLYNIKVESHQGKICI